MTGNKVANRTAKVSKCSPQNNSETITNEHEEKIPNEGYISRRKTENYWWSMINIII